MLNVIDHLYTFAEVRERGRAGRGVDCTAHAHTCALMTSRPSVQAHKLPPSEVYFIDVGANLGSFTLAVAAHGFRVLAFEAMYSNAMALSLALCDAPPATQELVALVNKVCTKAYCRSESAVLLSSALAGCTSSSSSVMECWAAHHPQIRRHGMYVATVHDAPCPRLLRSSSASPWHSPSSTITTSLHALLPLQGLGRQPGSCTLYSQAKNNRGNGVVRCGQHAPLPSW